MWTSGRPRCIFERRMLLRLRVPMHWSAIHRFDEPSLLSRFGGGAGSQERVRQAAWVEVAETGLSCARYADAVAVNLDVGIAIGVSCAASNENVLEWPCFCTMTTG